ncbi:MAG: hypothetical protein KBT34_01585 [Prevotella sp.]|nr:hypothetical protein [Candidatus Prevotella equi]
MKEFYLYLSFKPYVQQWLVSTFGDPVRFPHHSKENAEIRRQACPLPDGCIPQTRKEGDVAIVIPSSSMRKADTYNYFTASAQEALKDMIGNLFDCDMKTDILQSVENGVGIKCAVRSYMQRHHISIDHEETLKQRINRMVMAYRKNNVEIGNNFNKKMNHKRQKNT